MVGSTSHHNHSLDRTVELFTNLKSNDCVMCGQHSISKRHSELNDEEEHTWDIIQSDLHTCTHARGHTHTSIQAQYLPSNG